MSNAKTSLEIIAPSIEEAIARGAAELGLAEEDLDVLVLDEGKGGFLGIGARQARVRLTIRGSSPSASPPEAESLLREELDAETKSISSEDSSRDASKEVIEADPEIARGARDTVVELLQRMGIEAQVEAHWGEKPKTSHIWPLHIDIQGKDLSILIGRRGETLNALQYITRLIVGKEMRQPVAVVIDVAGYRKRREKQIRRLAQRMAQQAIEQGRTMALEPMPANERRLVHIELRANPEVETESIGDGDHRKVTIIPKR